MNLALDANMKYITFVIKHHDGFALWDSKVSDYHTVCALFNEYLCIVEIFITRWRL